MPFQSTDQPAMTPSSNAGARSLTFVHAFEVGERKLCAMLVWLCSKCDGVHIWMNSKVLVVGTTFSLASIISVATNHQDFLQHQLHMPPLARRVGHAGAASPYRPRAPGGRRWNSGAPSSCAQNARMHAPAAHPCRTRATRCRMYQKKTSPIQQQNASGTTALQYYKMRDGLFVSANGPLWAI